MVRLEGFGPPTSAFEAQRSVQLMLQTHVWWTVSVLNRPYLELHQATARKYVNVTTGLHRQLPPCGACTNLGLALALSRSQCNVRWQFPLRVSSF